MNRAPFAATALAAAFLSIVSPASAPAQDQKGPATSATTQADRPDGLLGAMAPTPARLDALSQTPVPKTDELLWRQGYSLTGYVLGAALAHFNGDAPTVFTYAKIDKTVGPGLPRAKGVLEGSTIINFPNVVKDIFVNMQIRTYLDESGYPIMTYVVHRNERYKDGNLRPARKDSLAQAIIAQEGFTQDSSQVITDVFRETYLRTPGKPAFAFNTKDTLLNGDPRPFGLAQDTYDLLSCLYSVITSPFEGKRRYNIHFYGLSDVVDVKVETEEEDGVVRQVMTVDIPETIEQELNGVYWCKAVFQPGLPPESILARVIKFPRVTLGADTTSAYGPAILTPVITTPTKAGLKTHK